MAQVDLYYAEDGPAYHFLDDCPVGSNIPPDKSLKGDGGKRLCVECSRMSMSDLTGPGMHP